MRSLKKYKNGKYRSKETIQRCKIKNIFNAQSKYVNRICQPVDFLNLSNRLLNDEERKPKYIFPTKHNLKSIIPKLESIL